MSGKCIVRHLIFYYNFLLCFLLLQYVLFLFQNAMECAGSGGAPPVSLAEFSFDLSSQFVWYDVSYVDGFNVPISITPLANNGLLKCQAVAACDLRNTASQLPTDMVVSAGVCFKNILHKCNMVVMSAICNINMT